MLVHQRVHIRAIASCWVNSNFCCWLEIAAWMSFVSNTRILSDPAFCCRLSDQGKPMYSIHFDLNFNPNCQSPMEIMESDHWTGWFPPCIPPIYPQVPPLCIAMHRYAPRTQKCKSICGLTQRCWDEDPAKDCSEMGMWRMWRMWRRCGDILGWARPGDETVAVKKRWGLGYGRCNEMYGDVMRCMERSWDICLWSSCWVENDPIFIFTYICTLKPGLVSRSYWTGVVERLLQDVTSVSHFSSLDWRHIFADILGHHYCTI